MTILVPAARPTGSWMKLDEAGTTEQTHLPFPQQGLHCAHLRLQRKHLTLPVAGFHHWLWWLPSKTTQQVNHRMVGALYTCRSRLNSRHALTQSESSPSSLSMSSSTSTWPFSRRRPMAIQPRIQGTSQPGRSCIYIIIYIYIYSNQSDQIFNHPFQNTKHGAW